MGLTKAQREEILKQKLASMKQIEKKLHEEGYSFIAGIDEVGRGPLAGPVYAACVVLPVDFNYTGIDDSKKLSEKKREELYEIITSNALAYGIGISDNHEIDEINILEATKVSMIRAFQNCNEKLKHLNINFNDNKSYASIDYLLIDALKLDIEIPQRGIIKGDSKSLSIAAASIIAKVERDRYMKEMDDIYPGYDFASNKGYGTKNHYMCLDEKGCCKIHRKSFLKKYEANK